MRYNFFLFKKLSIVGVLLLGLGACSVISEHNRTPEQAVKERAAERWQALIEDKLETAYTYLTPEYRKLYSYQQYKKSIHSGFWTKAEVKDVACTENCVVSMQIYVTIRPPRWGQAINSSSLLKEHWTRDKDSGEWFYLSSE